MAFGDIKSTFYTMKKVLFATDIYIKKFASIFAESHFYVTVPHLWWISDLAKMPLYMYFASQVIDLVVNVIIINGY